MKLGHKMVQNSQSQIMKKFCFLETWQIPLFKVFLSFSFPRTCSQKVLNFMHLSLGLTNSLQKQHVCKESWSWVLLEPHFWDLIVFSHFFKCYIWNSTLGFQQIWTDDKLWDVIKDSMIKIQKVSFLILVKIPDFHRV